MGKIDKMCNFAVGIANDNRHGYSQYHRWGPDYDCSSLVITSAEKAGYPVKSKYGATYTGNMYNAFLKAGFKDATRSVNFRTGAGLKKGDVLLSIKHHTELYIGNGLVVGANSDERGGIVGRQKGDQTGREIWVKRYFVYRKGWDCVLRPPAERGTYQPAKENNFKFIKTEYWRGITLDACNVRSTPSTKSRVVYTYPKGSVINYDSVYEGDGYRWISYISYSGKRRYVAYRRLYGNTKPWIKF